MLENNKVLSKNFKHIRLRLYIYKGIITFLLTIVYVILNSKIFHFSTIEYFIAMVMYLTIISFIIGKLENKIIKRMSTLNVKLLLLNYAEGDVKKHIHDSINIKCNISDIKTIKQLFQFKNIIATITINENNYLLEILAGVTEKNYIEELKYIIGNCLQNDELSYEIIINNI